MNELFEGFANKKDMITKISDVPVSARSV